MTTVRAVSATGALGSGYREETLHTALDAGADFIGCDGGSTDGGPHFLGSGTSKVSAIAYRRDLRPMLHAAVERSIPLIVGSSGYSGARPHLDWAAEIVREIARADGLSFTMALIDSEQDKDVLVEATKRGRVHPLEPAVALLPQTIQECSHVVAQIGPEPIEAALRAGAQVVIAGRATDPAIFAAVPRSRGLTGGPTWHAAKVLECGAAAVEQRPHPDCLTAVIEADAFTITPPNPVMRCTPQSVAAQTLYENADPYRIVEPYGVLDTSGSRYEQCPDGRSVRVTGSLFRDKDRYDVKLEGAAPRGYRSTFFGGVRDPVVLRQLAAFVADATASIERKVTESIGLVRDQDYTLTVRVYGLNACLGDLEPEPAMTGHEAAVFAEIVAPTQEQAHAICVLAWHTMLHHPVPEYSGLVSNLAFPCSPPHADMGQVYEFALNHVLEVDDPLEVVSIEMEQL